MPPGDGAPSFLVELRAMAGGEPAGSRFVVRGVDCEITVEQREEPAGGVRLIVPVPDESAAVQVGYREAGGAPVVSHGPIAIYLRGETAMDRWRKVWGASVEVETGSPTFDREVFVETHTQVESARRILSGEETQAAILLLLREGAWSILLDDWSGSIVVDVPGGVGEGEHEGRGSRLVRAVEALRGSLPRIARRPRAGFRGRIGAAPPGPSEVTKEGSWDLATLGGAVWGFLGGTLLSAFICGVFTAATYLPLTPDECWNDVLGEPGTRELVCRAPRCCEPFSEGLVWGLQGLAIAALPLILSGMLFVVRSSKKRAATVGAAVVLGLCGPVALAVGVLVARLRAL